MKFDKDLNLLYVFESIVMAGHSKWANIKHRKSAQDARRAKLFTRIIKELSIAVREFGADPQSNPRLRNALINAKGLNIPKDTLERAIKKASGSDADNYREICFEGYGPYGVAIFVECTTDNPTRTVANIRAIFNRIGGNLDKKGALDFIFERKGVFLFEKQDIRKSLEDFELDMIEGGAKDVNIHEDFITVYSAFEDFGSMQAYLEKLDVTPHSANLERFPKNTKILSIEEAKKILLLIERFEADEDVQNVYHNLEMTEAIRDEPYD